MVLDTFYVVVRLALYTYNLLYFALVPRVLLYNVSTYHCSVISVAARQQAGKCGGAISH